MSSHLAFVVGLTLVFVLAGFVKGTIGMGLPTVAIGLLTLLMRPAEAAAILILPSFVTNVWQLAVGPALAGDHSRIDRRQRSSLSLYHVVGRD